MADRGSNEDLPPRRVLDLVDAACIVFGAIIGVGIFFTPSGTAALTRSGVLMLLAGAAAGLPCAGR